MKRVLITGAAGFIGRQCIDPLLRKGYEVHAVSRSARPSDAQVTWHQADLLEESACLRLVQAIRPSHLLHMAWYAVPGKYWTATENFAWVRASLSLLQAFAENGGQRLVAAGTCAEYDWRHGWCSEGVTPLIPSTLYGTCKNSTQNMLEAYALQHGLSNAWGRIFFLYGPHEHPTRLVSSITKALLERRTAECSDGRQIRDFLHVADVADAFATLLDSSVHGALNIASGQPTTIRQVASLIADKIGAPELLKLGARATATNEPPLLLGDVRRLNDELGWRPRLSLEDGLDDTIAWWRKALQFT